MRAAQAARGADRRSLRRTPRCCSPTSSTSRRSRPDSAREVVALLNAVFSRLRRPGRAVRAGEDQDDRRRVHGRRRASRPAAGPRARRSPTWRSRCVRCERPADRGGRRAADRHRHRSGGRRRDRPAQVHLRPVGRHGQHGQPDGEPRRPGRDPGDRGVVAALDGTTRSSRAARSRSRARARWRRGSFGVRPSQVVNPHRLNEEQDRVADEADGGEDHKPAAGPKEVVYRVERAWFTLIVPSRQPPFIGACRNDACKLGFHARFKARCRPAGTLETSVLLTPERYESPGGFRRTPRSSRRPRPPRRPSRRRRWSRPCSPAPR